MSDKNYLRKVPDSGIEIPVCQELSLIKDNLAPDTSFLEHMKFIKDANNPEDLRTLNTAVEELSFLRKKKNEIAALMVTGSDEMYSTYHLTSCDVTIETKIKIKPNKSAA